MTLKNDAKFDEKLTSRFKIDMIMEYALLNKEETTLSLQLVWW